MQNKKFLALPPFTRALLERAAEEPVYFATPGHHAGKFFEETEAGRAFLEFFGKNLFRADLSDSDDAMGDITAHEGAAGKAERLAAKVWRADETYFVLGGTSAANRAAMEALLAPGDLALIDRSSHKSIYQGLSKTGADAVFVGGLRNGAGVIGGPSAEIFDEAALRRLAAEVSPEKAEAPRPFRLACLQLVTYDGVYLNVKKLLKTLGSLCEFILFDSAWGGYESFISFMTDENPLALPPFESMPGILVTQSVHKQLAGFSQTSQLHMKNMQKPCERCVLPDTMRLAMAPEISTSPFFPLFAGLEMNAALHKEKGKEIWRGTVRFGVELRKAVAAACHHIRPFQPESVAGKPWISYPTAEIAGSRRFWEICPGDAWHGLEGLTEGQALLDPCKVLLVTDFPAEILGKFLQERRVVPEKTGRHTLLLLAEPGDGKEKADALLSLLTEFESALDKNSPLSETLPKLTADFPEKYRGLGLVRICDAQEEAFRKWGIEEKERALFRRENFPKRAMTSREARDALIGTERCLVPLFDAPGRVSLTAVCAYPPGICEVAAGEVWNREAAEFFDTLFRFKTEFPGFGPELQGFVQDEIDGELCGYVWVRKGTSGR